MQSKGQFLNNTIIIIFNILAECTTEEGMDVPQYVPNENIKISYDGQTFDGSQSRPSGNGLEVPKDKDAKLTIVLTTDTANPVELSRVFSPENSNVKEFELTIYGPNNEVTTRSSISGAVIFSPYLPAMKLEFEPKSSKDDSDMYVINVGVIGCFKPGRCCQEI